LLLFVPQKRKRKRKNREGNKSGTTLSCNIRSCEIFEPRHAKAPACESLRAPLPAESALEHLKRHGILSHTQAPMETQTIQRPEVKHPAKLSSCFRQIEPQVRQMWRRWTHLRHSRTPLAMSSARHGVAGAGRRRPVENSCRIPERFWPGLHGRSPKPINT
jgi:hypothetical protein